jgi:hypothetical protein
VGFRSRRSVAAVEPRPSLGHQHPIQFTLPRTPRARPVQDITAANTIVIGSPRSPQAAVGGVSAAAVAPAAHDAHDVPLTSAAASTAPASPAAPKVGERFFRLTVTEGALCRFAEEFNMDMELDSLKVRQCAQCVMMGQCVQCVCSVCAVCVHACVWGVVGVRLGCVVGVWSGRVAGVCGRGVFARMCVVQRCVGLSSARCVTAHSRHRPPPFPPHPCTGEQLMEADIKMNRDLFVKEKGPTSPLVADLNAGRLSAAMFHIPGDRPYENMYAPAKVGAARVLRAVAKCTERPKKVHRVVGGA